jgi:hypothetical protein
MRPGQSILNVVIHDREYYEGRGDVLGLRCEKWGEESRELAGTIDNTSIVGAFVPPT